MNIKSHVLLAAAVPALAVGFLVSVNAKSSTGEMAKEIERGRHLVENIAMCADWHSMRNPDGSFDPTCWLAGSALGFTPTVEMPWAPAAPAISGLPTMTDEEAVRFFMTGNRPTGVPVLPPMPAYRMSRDEAEAVVAYLRSLSARS